MSIYVYIILASKNPSFNEPAPAESNDWSMVAFVEPPHLEGSWNQQNFQSGILIRPAIKGNQWVVINPKNKALAISWGGTLGGGS